MDFSLEEFTDAYKVHKREKPVVVGEECHMHFVYFLKTPKL